MSYITFNVKYFLVRYRINDDFSCYFHLSIFPKIVVYMIFKKNTQKGNIMLEQELLNASVTNSKKILSEFLIIKEIDYKNVKVECTHFIEINKPAWKRGNEAGRVNSPCNKLEENTHPTLHGPSMQSDTTNAFHWSHQENNIELTTVRF